MMEVVTNAEEARASLEAAHERFSALVLGLSDEEWDLESHNDGWTNGQLCWHIAWGTEQSVRFILRLSRNRGIDPPAPLMSIFDFLSLWMVRFRSRNATPQAVLTRFNRGWQTTLDLADQIGSDEWGNGATVHGTQMTVGDGFARLQDHVEEHAAEMRREL